MHTRERYGFILIVFMLGSLAQTTYAATDAVWRIAGTFNTWNASDDEWRLDIHPDRSWIFRTEKLLQPGTYRFKFVRNGDWRDAHLGLVAGSDTGLEQPGEDIVLEVPGLGFYGFELNTQDLTWSLDIARVDRPIVSALWFGPREIGEPMTLVYASSITNNPLTNATVNLKLSNGPEGFNEADTELNFDADRKAISFIPTMQGTYEFALTIKDAGTQSTAPFAFTIPPASNPLDEPETNRIAFTYRGDPRTTSVELVGPITQVLNSPNGSVHLSPWAVDIDGAKIFQTVLRVPDGAHEYGFRINGAFETADPTDPEARLTDSRSLLLVGPRPSNFEPAQPGSINTKAVLFDEHSPLDWSVLSDGLGLVDVSLRTLPGDVSAAGFVYYPVDAEDGIKSPFLVPLVRKNDPTGFDRWSARIYTGRAEFDYQFMLFDQPARYSTPLVSARLEPDGVLDLPDWAKGAVYYQIFAERFRNGNPQNDPSGPSVFQMPWNSDWYTNQPGEEQQWRPRAGLDATQPLPSRQGGELFHWVWDRRYGGDLQGVVEKLDYIRDLGITAIYFNPVFEGDSMHKYDASAFHHIDDNFGAQGPLPHGYSHEPDNRQDDPAIWGWSQADRYFLDVLLPEARSRGIRVVIDGVWNHTGRNFWAWQDILQHGAESPYAEWFYVNFDSEGRVESWQAWDGPNGWLPKFRQTSTGDLIEPVKRHIYDVTRRWMDPNGDGDPSDGVDGWRLDVPLDIGLPFWEDWRVLVKSINPEAVIIAEIWQPADPYLTGQHFDTQMHYPFAHAVTDWLGVRPGMTSAQLAARLEAAFNDAPQTNLIHQNLFASHDTDRFVSMLINPGRGYDQANRPQDNGPGYRDVRPSEDVYQRSLLGVAIQSLYLGAPMVYNGDEVGMWGADDPTNRKPMPWPDQAPYENPDDRFDEDLLEEYSRWLNLRQNDRLGPVLRYGTVRHLETGDPDVFAFERQLNNLRVIAVINRGQAAFDAVELLPEGLTDNNVPPVSARYWPVTEALSP